MPSSANGRLLHQCGIKSDGDGVEPSAGAAGPSDLSEITKTAPGLAHRSANHISPSSLLANALWKPEAANGFRKSEQAMATQTAATAPSPEYAKARIIHCGE